MSTPFYLELLPALKCKAHSIIGWHRLRHLTVFIMPRSTSPLIRKLAEISREENVFEKTLRDIAFAVDRLALQSVSFGVSHMRQENDGTHSQ